MSTQIQEPSSISQSEINPQTENNFEILVYQRSQDFAGLKKLALVGWKNYLGFNSTKVDNLAKLTGFTPEEYGSDTPIDPPTYTLKQRVQGIADQTGVSFDPQPSGTTLASRISTLEGETETLNDWVHDGYSEEIEGTTVVHDGLLTRVSDIETELGGGGGVPAGQDLFTRMRTAESNISTLQQEVETPDIGLIAKVSTLETNVGTPTPGGPLSGNSICYRVESNTAEIGTLDTTQTPVTGTGIKKDIYDIQQVNTTQGNDIQTLQGDVSTLQTDVDNLKQTVTTVYNVKGNIDQTIINSWQDADYESFKTGDVFNVKTNPTGGTVNITVPVQTGETPTTMTLQDGANIVWIENSQGETHYKFGCFDELGTAIDVAEVNRLSQVVGSNTAPKTGLCRDVSDLQATVNNPSTGVAALNTKVTALESKYQTDSNAANHWVSGDGTSQGLSGRYIITADCNNPSSTAIFYMRFSANGICITGDTKCMDGSNADYTTFFSVDPDDGYIKAKATTPYVSVSKIGD